MIANRVQARMVASFNERDNLGIVALQDFENVLFLILHGPSAHLL